MGVVEAQEIARSALAEELPARWAHTQAVAAQAATLRPVFGDVTDRLEAAAWLHDIGYASGIRDTGFHALDGARHLRDRDLEDELVRTLVAHHSCASFEADVRGLAGELAEEFPAATERVRNLVTALTYCDMTVGPNGQPMTVQERIEDILTRYDQDDAVHQSIAKAAPVLRTDVAIVSALLARTTPPPA